MANFTFLNSPIHVAHHFWKQMVETADHVIDATLGNGQDALFLAPLCSKGKLIGIDIQEQAIRSSQELLKGYQNIEYVVGSHASFPSHLLPETIKLIVYNLGYLPRGDKTIVTQTSSTLESLQNALPLLVPGGMVSMTCYSGHEEGANEEKALIDFSRSLNPRQWSVSHQQWLNRHRCPSLLLILKSLDET
ncbi:MAG: tRNA (mnm(5)s(2)U34)-methyltransferase [Parachlamydiaceae bacterium]